MPSALTNPILLRFRREVGAIYGASLDRVVLFDGRGDERPDSDIDL
jgi:hypothetical protein